MDAVAKVGIAAPWILFPWLSYAIACHRWVGWRFDLSLAVSGAAALAGWGLVRRSVARLDDAQLGDLLLQVEDAPAWALFPHPVQIIKREHAARCHQRWGVTPRTSGWTQFRQSWQRDVALSLGCLAVTVHPCWLGL